MIEPISLLLQKKLYESIFNDLQKLIASGLTSAGLASDAPPGVRRSAFDDLITAAAQRHDLDPSLLKALVQAESNFSPGAVSRAGAKGLMQLMDSTAQQLGVSDPFDPAQNIDGGARFLRQLLDRYQGNEILALAAYNAGPTAVERWGGIPPYLETQTYVPRVLGLRERYREWRA